MLELERLDGGPCCVEGFIPSHHVVTVRYNGWSAIGDALCEGRMDGGFLPIPEAISLYRSGLDIRLVLFDSRLGAMVIANQSAGVKKMADFKGKSVLISSRRSVLSLLFRRLMNRAGLSLCVGNGSALSECNAESVYLEEAPPALMQEMIRCDVDGDIGGCVVEEPYASKILQQGDGVRLCHTGMMWSEHPHSALVIHQKCIDAHFDDLMIWLEEVYRRHQKIYKNSPHLFGFSSCYFNTADEGFEQLCVGGLPEMPHALIPDKERVKIIWDMAQRADAGHQKSAFNGLIDDRFSEISEDLTAVVGKRVSIE